MLTAPSAGTRSIQDLLTATEQLAERVPSVREAFSGFTESYLQMRDKNAKTRVAVIGTIKAGKSTLMNSFIGHDILPRGSGVKTFNLMRITHDAERLIRLQFKPAHLLTAHLRHDFRILGADVAVPANPYEKNALQEIKRLYQQLEQLSATDGRLQRIENDDNLLSLLALSLARVRKSIAGLEELHQNFPEEIVKQIIATASIELNAAQLDTFKRWTDSHNIAALILEIRYFWPFREELSADVELIDCQGSDSLNPLDFAAVNSILHHADRILYVVNSRLGLRKADRQLLVYLQQSAIMEKLTFVLNVEVHEPMANTELEKLRLAMQKELGHFRNDAPVHTVSSLAELMRVTGDEEYANAKAQWERKGFLRTFHYLNEQYQNLRSFILQKSQDNEPNEQALWQMLYQRAISTADALLSRDNEVLGISSQAVRAEEINAALKRIIDGEMREAERQLTIAATTLFAKEGPMVSEVKTLFSQGTPKLIAQQLPENILNATDHAPLIEAATAVFNQTWGDLEAKLRNTFLQPFQATVEPIFMTTVERLAHMILGLIPADLKSGHLGDTLEPSRLRDRLHNELINLFMATPLPSILDPVVLPYTIQNPLIASFYSKRAFEMLKTKVFKKPVTTEDSAKKAKTLFENTLKKTFQYAEGEAQLSLSSSVENLRYQYLFFMMRKLCDQLVNFVMFVVEDYEKSLEQLTKANALLLHADARQQVTQYRSLLLSWEQPILKSA